jgi:2-polyprenyl-3-methyl-5-hydroxy-6-metoxy-1,4-benzoquinol methylase
MVATNRAVYLMLKGIHRTVGGMLPPTLLSRRYPDIPGRIHIDDSMLRAPTSEGLAHYVSDARSAIDNIEASLAVVGTEWSAIASCLDLPCGYGRVTRLLARELPPSRITACDLDPRAVRFCSAEFGVLPLYSKTDLREVEFPHRYDLIFVGSLLTHLPDDACHTTLRVLTRTLGPGGLIVFSTQGLGCLNHLDWYGKSFAAAEHVYRENVAARGTHFMPYGSRTPGYGVTLHSRSYVEQLVHRASDASLALVRFAERGWDDHQDVWSYRLPS